MTSILVNLKFLKNQKFSQKKFSFFHTLHTQNYFNKECEKRATQTLQIFERSKEQNMYEKSRPSTL